MSLHSIISTSHLRQCDPVITAASIAADGKRKATTAKLLEAIAKHEGDSDLGQLATSILQGGDFYVRNSRAEYEDSAHACENIVGYAERLADEWRLEAESMAEVLQ